MKDRRWNSLRWTLLWVLTLGGALFAAPHPAEAGEFEISFGFSYNSSNYGEGNFAWSRRWGASVGYHFTDITELEISFQDIMDRTKIDGFQDTTFNDRIYSLNVVQGFFKKTFPIQPYVKAGLGQLNRDATGTYASGASPPAQLDSLTAVLGVGVRIYLFKRFAIRGEATSYLTGGAISTWLDNTAFSSGLSVFF